MRPGLTRSGASKKSPTINQMLSETVRCGPTGLIPSGIFVGIFVGVLGPLKVRVLCSDQRENAHYRYQHPYHQTRSKTHQGQRRRWPSSFRRADRFKVVAHARAVWTIPAARTKMRREHRKPLSPSAVELLTHLAQFTGEGRLAFASALSPGNPMSENTMNLALRRMGFSKAEATSHGFRASASSLLNESGLWSADAIEAELGHATSGAVRRAYHRAAYWGERVKMSAWWSENVLAMT
jgi:integrase